MRELGKLCCNHFKAMAFNQNCILLCQKDFVLTPCIDATEQTTATNKTIYSFQFITPLKISSIMYMPFIFQPWVCLQQYCSLKVFSKNSHVTVVMVGFCRIQSHACYKITIQGYILLAGTSQSTSHQD